MKTFRTIAVIAITSLAVVFTNCKPEEEKDVTPPTIIVPSGVIDVDLGDKVAALKGITASDEKDGDLTASIKVLSEMERIGLDTIKYEVYDAAGNKATATRVVKVTCNKITEGKVVLYNVEYTDVRTNVVRTYPNPMEVTEDQTGVAFVVTRFHYLGNNIVKFISDGPRRLKIEEKHIPGYSPAGATLSGDVTFGSTDETKSKYNLISFRYKFTHDDPNAGTDEFTAICTRVN